MVAELGEGAAREAGVRDAGLLEAGVLEADGAADDETLIRAIARGEQRAFEQLIARHAPRLVRMATRMLASRTEAEEVVQDAFARVWVNAGKWRSAEEGGRARFGTWLYRVAVNLCIDRKRRPASASIDDVPEPVDPADGAFALLAERDTVRQVREAVASLPERQRAALVLCVYEGQSNQAAGEVLGLSVGAVESLLVRARRTLRDRLIGVYAELKED